MKPSPSYLRNIAIIVCAFIVTSVPGFAVSKARTTHTSLKTTRTHASIRTAHKSKAIAATHSSPGTIRASLKTTKTTGHVSIKTVSVRTTRRGSASRYREPFVDSTKDDVAEYDDPAVRQAAIDALGHYNGSVVAIDPSNGRILSIVNQKLAFSAGFIPCSTIKPVIAVAALQEGFVTRDTMIRVAPRKFLNLTEALAHSNNAFFEELGRRMGFDTVSHYGRLLGLGELAGYQIPEEHPGGFPTEPPVFGGVARMSSFGQGIQMTPLQLGALATSIANGGTLYYLQYPRTAEERETFAPRVKRNLNIEALLPEIRDGMLAAVLYGTARQSYISDDEQAAGKTGTCSEDGSRLGWFVSYADQTHPKIVLVVLMRGHSSAIKGAMAAGVAGRIYRRLNDENYFGAHTAEAPTTSVETSSLQ